MTPLSVLTAFSALILYLAIFLLGGYLLGMIASVPIAAVNKLRKGKFEVSKLLKIFLTIFCAILIFIYLLDDVKERNTRSIIRLQMIEGINLASNFRSSLMEYHHAHDTFEGLNLDEIGQPAQGQYIEQIYFAEVSDNTVSIIAKFKTSQLVNQNLRGLELRYATEDGGETWSCGYAITNPVLQGENLVPSQYMPNLCNAH